MTQPRGADAPDIQLSPRAKLEILGAILLALFLFALDQTVVGTALPRIVTDLKGNDLYVWAVTIYLLTSTISGPIYGKLSDLFGRRPIIIWAVIVFLAGSVLSGLSQEMWQFILFRGIQGLGGGAVFPVALAVVADLYTPAERGKYLGFFGAVFGLSSLVGPFIGGGITDLISWHWIFFVNVPLGLISLVILWRLLPAIKRPDAARHIDYLGAAVFAGAIAPFLIGLTNKSPIHDWSDPVVGGLMLLGLVLGVVFVFIESRVPEPIVPLGLFRIRAFTVSVSAMFLAGFGFLSAVIFLPRWFQTVAGASATESGLNILPLLAGLIFSAIASGQIVARTHRYKYLMLGSLALLAIGLFLMTNIRADTDRPVLWLWMLHHRSRHRSVVRGLHAGRAERGRARPHWCRDQQPDLLPADRRDDRPHPRGERCSPAALPRRSRSGSRPPACRRSSLGNSQAGAARWTSRAPVTSANGSWRRCRWISRPFVQPLIPGIVQAIYDSVSIAIAASFWVGIVAAVVAVIVVVFLPEAPMRDTFEMVEGDAGHPEPAPG